MTDKELDKYLQPTLIQDVDPERLEKTIQVCKQIMREQIALREENRLSFTGYLSNVFRFKGLPILLLQTVAWYLLRFFYDLRDFYRILVKKWDK